MNMKAWTAFELMRDLMNRGRTAGSSSIFSIRPSVIAARHAQLYLEGDYVPLDCEGTLARMSAPTRGYIMIRHGRRRSTPHGELNAVPGATLEQVLAGHVDDGAILENRIGVS